ncbi:MAG: putative secreted protein [Candidatus Phytoplasma solani]
MKLSTKIYLSFLAIFSLILFVLFIVGLTKTPSNSNTNQNPTQNTHTQQHGEEKQNNKELNPKEKEALSQIQTRLQELESINQKNRKFKKNQRRRQHFIPKNQF